MTDEERLTAIFREVFNEYDLVLTRDMTDDDIQRWDSLSNIHLVIAIEQAFGFRFSLGDLPKLMTVGAMLDIIAEKKTR